MEKEFNLIKQLEEAVDELWRNAPPRVELKGWWWKKYIPHYRRMQSALQHFIDMNWQDNYPEIQKEIEKMEKDYFFQQTTNYKKYSKSNSSIG